MLSASRPHLYPEFMQGAIAAGNQVTAEAGARVLTEGGNAVDACIAAAFAAAVTEGPLTGPTGGGFLLAWVEGEVTVLDCFFAAPTRPLGELEDLTIDFGDSTQSYHVGDGSVAVPGHVAGLEEAHRRWATLPWPQLVEPAIDLAERGFDATEVQLFLHLILAGILQRDEGGRRIYGVPERIETADFVPTLKRLRDSGSDAVTELLPELADDIAAYRVGTPEPLHAHVGALEVLTTPAPSRGGTPTSRTRRRTTHVTRTRTCRRRRLPPGLVVLARAEVPLNTGGFGTAEMTCYDHHGGGFVFSVGSLTFGGSLVKDPGLQTIAGRALSECCLKKFGTCPV